MSHRNLFNGSSRATLSLDAARGTGMRVENVRMVAEGSPFADLYTPDDSKAFMEFEVCNSYPDFLGPVLMGKDVANYCCFFPDTLEASHESLQFQQLNLNHLLKAYGDEEKGKPSIRNDRIIGCIVATSFPERPVMGGWRTPGKPDGATAKITCCAVLFKLAQGVDKMIGGHQTNKDPQSISIEVNTSFDNLGVFVPSTEEIFPLVDPTEDIFSAYKIVKGQPMPIIGKLKTEAHPEGEQLLVSYGMSGKPVHFAGVGVTGNPAEKAARILKINAHQANTVAIAAESVFQALQGKKVTFPSTRRVGMVQVVSTKGIVKHPVGGFSRKATDQDPVLTILMPDGVSIMRHYSEMVGQIS